MMNPGEVLILKTDAWRVAERQLFDHAQLAACEIAVAVPKSGNGVRVVKHPAYPTPFIVPTETVDYITNRPTKTFYSVDGEVWFVDLPDALDQQEKPDGCHVGRRYMTCQFRPVLLEAMATSAAAVAIERFIDDVAERAGEEAADKVAGTLPEEELGVVIFAWLKTQLKFDIMVQAGTETEHTVTAEDVTYQERAPEKPEDPDPVWLIKTYGIDDVRFWVTDVRNSKRTVDDVTACTIKDASDSNRQRFRRGLRWCVETPDVEWERFGGEEGRAA